MSKKKKFKKFSRADLLREIETTNEIQSDNVAKIQDKRDFGNKNREDIVQKGNKSIGAEMSYVKNDIKRIMIVLTVTLLTLLALIMLDKQTSVLNNLTNELLKIFNINQ